MSILITSGAMLQCTFGAAPASLNVLPIKRIDAGAPVANIMDHLPVLNIPPFGSCACLANPQVAAATSAALGALTPVPCMPMTGTPWLPGSPTVLAKKIPALQDTSMLLCSWGGEITIVAPAQFTTLVA
ncbi:DUF4280 domain-containing protein [Robbsia sp. Bb-Pol-6]|uniref:DUF4280 domain-containing protein n=1 Tax=Robbsia betulipollinis TaxID=2981849 RepID=A0ABT3ZKA3_9BURK|nr:DUF4280 domain-containing protein [Robbsia betulipollinis]MCY0386976.1 DUF4280 domain-containing protein [Robbsia betulipollinis]